MSEVFRGVVQIARRDVGMISLRGDLASEGFSQAVKDVMGVQIPEVRKTTGGERALVWMSPDELLALVPYSEAPAYAARLSDRLGTAHSLVADVSDARAFFSLTGAGWREVLAKGAPVDLRLEAFGPGDVRRTRIGQVAAALWCSRSDRADMVCFRSVGDFMFDWLCTAAEPGTLPGVLTS